MPHKKDEKEKKKTKPKAKAKKQGCGCGCTGSAANKYFKMENKREFDKKAKEYQDYGK